MLRHQSDQQSPLSSWGTQTSLRGSNKVPGVSSLRASLFPAWAECLECAAEGGRAGGAARAASGIGIQAAESRLLSPRASALLALN